MDMDYFDYRERLGLSIDDRYKQQIFITRIQNLFQAHPNIEFNAEQEYDFCNKTGVTNKQIRTTITLDFLEVKPTGLQRAWLYLDDLRNSFSEFLASLVTFVNTYTGAKDCKEFIMKSVRQALDDSHIQYDLTEDEDGTFIFPKGAPELDDALVSAPLEWLSEYPDSQKAWIKALKDYSDQTDDNASNIADRFRKALETFFQEFFNQNKSLENLKSVYGTYLKTHGVPGEISNNLETLLLAYTNYMNANVKHHDKAAANVLEYIMYQTGNIIRLLITLKREDTDDAD